MSITPRLGSAAAMKDTDEMKTGNGLATSLDRHRCCIIVGSTAAGLPLLVCHISCTAAVYATAVAGGSAVAVYAMILL